MVKLCSNTWDEEDLEIFHQYPYSLSPFQKYAIQAILQGQHVLVTAPTGSGKTLPAEFAIQHFTQQGKRVIYTSPIKALSNQKYYQFSQTYPHISFGLLTGDIKTNPTAQVLLMTTEILMNTLIHSSGTDADADAKAKAKPNISELTFQLDINELAAVVFDEVHYINDKERGQTWEKTLLLLTPNIQRIMLSATIDAPERFAQWVEDAPLQIAQTYPTKQSLAPQEKDKKQVWICSSPTRVVPLHHFAYNVVPSGIFKRSQTQTPQAKPTATNAVKYTNAKITNQKAQIQTKNQKPTLSKEQEQELKQIAQKFLPLTAKDFTQTYISLKKAQEMIQYTKTHISRPFVLNQLFKQLKDEDKLPAIAFVFSRKNVERYAQEVTVPLLEDDSKIPYTTSRDCEQIIRRLPNYREFLQLPEYIELVKLLEKGIGIHHSGMIPILREIVELQISQKKIKLLFATESFAIGLDCPIRTVVFTEVNKFDGTEERILLPHEYTQMAGRAGRRGIDTVGYVIHTNNLFDLPSQSEYKNLVSGKNQTLQSKFRISYELLLSLLATDPSNAKSQQDFVQFVEHSMLQNEILKDQKALEQAYDKHLSSSLSYSHLPMTPQTQEDIERFLMLTERLPTVVNKQKKEVQKELDTLVCIVNKEWIEPYQKQKKWEQEKQHIESQLAEIRERISQQIQKMIQILETNGMIEALTENENFTPKWKLTTKGSLAVPLSEIPCLLFSEFLPNLKELDTLEWVLLLSCFAGQRMEEVSALAQLESMKQQQSQNPWEIEKQSHPMNTNTSLEFISNLLTEHFLPKIQYYQTTEFQQRLYTGINYEEMGNPSLAPFLLEWCGTETEQDCQWILQTKLPDTISVGDFTKAVLKIIASAKQLVSVLENKSEWLEIVSALSKVESMVAKYVVSCQSLYV